MNLISFTKLKWTIMWLLSKTDFSNSQRKHVFEVDEGCQDFPKIQVGKLMKLPSLTQCARMCLDTDLCQFFSSWPGDADALWCKLASNNTLPPSIDTTSAPQSQSRGVWCYKRIRDASTNTAGQSSSQSKNGTIGFADNNTEKVRDCENSNNWFSYCYEDLRPDLHQSGWVDFVDSNFPNTQTDSPIESSDNLKEAKMVVYDAITDTFHALTALIKSWSVATFVYAIEKDEQRFGENPSRIVYTGTLDGKLFSNLIHSNGTFTFTQNFFSNMHIYVNEPGEYSIIHNGDSNVTDIVEDIENGYKAETYKFTYVSPVGPVAIFYHMNGLISSQGDGNPDRPMKYIQRVQCIPGKRQICLSLIGMSGGIEQDSCQHLKVSTFRLSPLWKRVAQDVLDKHEQMAIVSRHMIQGHKVRIAFGNGCFDVDDIIQTNQDIYFILPQDYDRPAPKYYRGTNVGLRAVISSNGYLSWCSHSLEEENVLDHGSRVRISVRHFVDTKAWSAALSVFSNGTIAFGSVQKVPYGAKGGRDVNVLIEWLNDDLKRQFTAFMLTVKGFGTPDVLVSAESGVSWSLVRQPDGKMAIDGDCNMEKVLANSNGEVQVLVYNVHYRRPSWTEQDTRTTWFLY